MHERCFGGANGNNLSYSLLRVFKGFRQMSHGVLSETPFLYLLIFTLWR